MRRASCAMLPLRTSSHTGGTHVRHCQHVCGTYQWSCSRMIKVLLPGKPLLTWKVTSQRWVQRGRLGEHPGGSSSRLV